MFAPTLPCQAWLHWGLAGGQRRARGAHAPARTHTRTAEAGVMLLHLPQEQGAARGRHGHRLPNFFLLQRRARSSATRLRLPLPPLPRSPSPAAAAPDGFYGNSAGKHGFPARPAPAWLPEPTRRAAPAPGSPASPAPRAAAPRFARGGLGPPTPAPRGCREQRWGAWSWCSGTASSSPAWDGGTLLALPHTGQSRQSPGRRALRSPCDF